MSRIMQHTKGGVGKQPLRKKESFELKRLLDIVEAVERTQLLALDNQDSTFINEFNTTTGGLESILLTEDDRWWVRWPSVAFSAVAWKPTAWLHRTLFTFLRNVVGLFCNSVWDCVVDFHIPSLKRTCCLVLLLYILIGLPLLIQRGSVAN
ncbi:hypothetical protein CDEST_12744 [Colletotrichum destructivum]|uniref:Uncharacterized protein n=1 Tax=Colletotrichum destructivum TaxID=34406 RepID=A0AAX4IWU9_9PEZI|nr:hypothetical protein CDEST_12744 [Colletotrichum destructivum]